MIWQNVTEGSWNETSEKKFDFTCVWFGAVIDFRWRRTSSISFVPLLFASFHFNGPTLVNRQFSNGTIIAYGLCLWCRGPRTFIQFNSMLSILSAILHRTEKHQRHSKWILICNKIQFCCCQFELSASRMKWSKKYVASDSSSQSESEFFWKN